MLKIVSQLVASRRLCDRVTVTCTPISASVRTLSPHVVIAAVLRNPAAHQQVRGMAAATETVPGTAVAMVPTAVHRLAMALATAEAAAQLPAAAVEMAAEMAVETVHLAVHRLAVVLATVPAAAHQPDVAMAAIRIVPARSDAVTVVETAVANPVMMIAAKSPS